MSPLVASQEQILGRSDDHDDHLEIEMREMRPRRSGSKGSTAAREEKLRTRSLKEQLWHGMVGVWFWVICNDLTTTEPWESQVNQGNHPLLWP